MLIIKLKNSNNHHGVTTEDLKINFEDLQGIFDEKKMIDLHNGKILPTDPKAIEDLGRSCYEIASGRWDLSAGGRDSGFDKYVENWMNESEISDLRDLTEDGIDGSTSDLMWTDKCHEILKEYLVDIETKITEIVDHEFLDDLFPNGFNFETLVKVAFEDTVRKVLIDSGIEI